MVIDPSMYLQPARYIEAGHEKIIRTAKNLSSPDPMKTAENIYRFVSDRVRSDRYSSSEYGAIYALEHGRGDCTESMYLFVAL
jgi:transglutaminase-like putative cysteine protease